ncbi:MAG: anaerobic ribonucleoside-triphosphate reductase activating protein [Lachnospiraceae bacterium]|jgi:anaerobic ribonucleoside-triphosphate reductase activating protein
MNYAEIKAYDIADGPGVRVSLFVSGCTHHCEDCFNEVAWDFRYGKPFTKEVEDQLIESLKPDYIQGLTLLGGEPLEPANQKGLLPFVRRVRRELPDKDIWCYTGYLYTPDGVHRVIPETSCTEELLSYLDVLVDGPYIKEQKNISLLFRGSENQRLIDLPRTRKEGKVVLWTH